MNLNSTDLPRVNVDRGSFHPYPCWLLRVWSGMRTRDWIHILSQSGFRMDLDQLPWVVLTTMLAPWNSILAVAQNQVFGGVIRRTKIEIPPVFILGHWRCGTTLLHELLALDDRFSTPSNYKVYAPHHFLISERFAQPILRFVFPRKRPMDGVVIDGKSPQEDEYAWLVTRGPSPYTRIVKPHDWEENLKYLDMRNVSEDELNVWKESFLSFLKCVTFQTKRRLLLKSPPHTARVHVLREMFPEAKFIHITRHPHVMIPSTVRLWHALDATQALRRGRLNDVEPFVLETAQRMYTSFFEHSEAIPPEKMFETRYEDLVADPLCVLEEIYKHLDLDNFSAVRPLAEAYLRSRSDYQTNVHDVPLYWRNRITRDMDEYMNRYGYAPHDIRRAA